MGFRLALVAAALVLASCGGAETTPVDPPTSAVSGADTTAPSVPASVAAATVSTTQIRVSWQASSDTGVGVSGYRIFRNGGNAPIATVQATDWTDSGLNPDTSYSYTVLAFDGATPSNASAQSGAVTARTQPTPASAPGSATLSWLPPTDNEDGSALTNLAGYRIYGGTSAASLSLVSTISNAGITSTVVSNLAPATTHYFAVSAYSSNGAESLRSTIGSKSIP